ncbi:MAG: zinc-dependent metalloprotease [Bacteroidota bacterium]
MKLVRFSFFLLLAITFSSSVFAQDIIRGCATPPHKSEGLIKYQKGLIPRVEKSVNIQYVPVQLFILGENDGSGYTSPLAILEAFDLLNSDFESMNIHFFLTENIRYINSSVFNNHTFQQGRTMMAQNNLPGVINVYIVESPAGACGYYSPSGDAIALGKNCIGAGDRTWSHEMGHFLSLPHTFFGWECVEEISEIPSPAPAVLGFPTFPTCDNNRVELMDGSNCDSAADGFCDTPPDYLMERWTCSNQGMYPDSLTDPNGVRFAVRGINIMSYANDGCVDEFTEDQQGAMLTDLDSRVGLVDNDDPQTVAAEEDDLVQISPENNEDIAVSDMVELVWNSVPNAEYYVVQLHSSSNLNGAVQLITMISDTTLLVDEGLVARRRYYWRVRPVNRYEVEGDFSETIRFRMGEFPTSTIDQALNAAITVAPNPVSGGQFLRINGQNLGSSGALSLELMNAAGQVIVAQQQDNVSAAGFTQDIPTAGLPAGVYFLRLQLNERLVTRRIVVTP